MSYKVIKQVNGNPYLYEQTSYRDGKKVKTVSRYLGRAGELDIKLYSKKGVVDASRDKITTLLEDKKEAKAKINQEIKDSRQKINSVLKPPQKPTGKLITTKKQVFEKEAKAKINQEIKDSRQKINSALKPSQKPTGKLITTKKQVFGQTDRSALDCLSVGMNLKKYGVSEQALAAKLKKIVDIFAFTGVRMNDISNIRITHGQALKYGKSNFFARKLLNRGYVLTIPRGNKSSVKIRKDFAKLAVLACLDTLKLKNPQVYKKLKAAFKPTYNKTTEITKEYHKAIFDKDKSKLKLLDKGYVGNLSYLSKRRGKFKKLVKYKTTLKPEELGLIDFEPRQNWKEEFAGIMAEMLRRHADTTKLERRKRLNKYKAWSQNIKGRLEQYSQWSKIMKSVRRVKEENNLKRIEIRIRGQEEYFEKIKIIEGLKKMRPAP